MVIEAAGRIGTCRSRPTDGFWSCPGGDTGDSMIITRWKRLPTRKGSRSRGRRCAGSCGPRGLRLPGSADPPDTARLVFRFQRHQKLFPVDVLPAPVGVRLERVLHPDHLGQEVHRKAKDKPANGRDLEKLPSIEHVPSLVRFHRATPPRSCSTACFISGLS